MNAFDIASKTQKVIQMNKDQYVINGVYFNPYFTKDLFSKVPELAQSGLHSTTSETETRDGTLLSSSIVVTSTGEELKLGSVFLDGETVKVKNRLCVIDRLVKFVLQVAKRTEGKSVQEKELDKSE